jgi:MoaA/NifB/PqqE/SkfB family radical SAM enzyme
MLPDGRATRCRYLPDRDDLVIGSLADQSIVEVWDGARLRELNGPPRDRYAATACHGCGGFDGCHARGRCYFTALAATGRLHAPDAFCGREAGR